jgi:hypothetical protein
VVILTQGGIAATPDIIDTTVEFDAGTKTQMATETEIANLQSNALFIDADTTIFNSEGNDPYTGGTTFQVGKLGGIERYLAQSVSLSNSRIISKVNYYIQGKTLESGNSPGPMWVEVREDNGGNPTGTLLSQSPTYLPGIGAYNAFILNKPVYLQSGTTYWLVLRSNTPIGGVWQISANATGVYAGGHAASNNGGVWTHHPTFDMGFEFFSSPNYSTGGWKSDARTMLANHFIKSVNVKITGDVNNKITSFKIRDSSDTLLATCNAVPISTDTLLGKTDFIGDIEQIREDWKYDIEFAGGSTPIMSEIITGIDNDLFDGRQFKLFLDGVLFPYWLTMAFAGRIGALRTATFTVPNPRGLHTARFHTNQVTEIQFRKDNLSPWVTVFKGYMDNPSDTVQGQQAIITLTCRDNGAPLADEMTVDSEWEPFQPLQNTDPFDIISYLVNKLRTSLEFDIASQRNEEPLPISYTFERGVYSINIVQKMGDYGEYEWKITYGGKMLVRPPKEISVANVKRTYILGKKSDFTGLPDSPVGYILSENVDEDGEILYNSLGIKGKNDSFGHYTDEASVRAERLRHRYITDENLESDQLQQIAKGFVDREGKIPRKEFSIVVPGTFDIDRGDIIYVDDLRFRFSIQPVKAYRIISKSDAYSNTGFITTLQLGNTVPTVSETLKEMVL